MLRPFKNFLTYLQRNANGSIFGQSTNMNDTETNSNTTTVTDKSSPAIANPSGPSTSTTAAQTDIIILDSDDSVSITSIQNKNIYEDSNIISIDSEEDFDNKVQNDDKQFPDSEILIINENVNSAFTSDPCSDPLAFDDDFPLEIPDTSLPPVSDLVSSNGNIVYIIDVDEIKEQTIKIEQKPIKKSCLDKISVLQNTGVTLEEQELRSDGSDSGLGSETSGLQSTTANGINAIQIQSSNKNCGPIRSNLKRRGSLEVETSLEKRPKKSINFDGVKIYYFPRIQGFACIPSQGGCTLGMGARHVSTKTLTLAEHAAEQRRAHRLQMQEVNPRGSSSEESDSDYEISDGEGSDLDAEANGFLQPVPVKQRRALLKAAGVRKIDSVEKNDCRTIRSSREFCGCSCRGYCDPDTCACSLAGIKCQVDRPNFPCGCTRDGCANIVGRVEFNPGRVRTHYIHTIMRLDLENKQISTADEVETSGKLPSSRSMLFGNSSCDTSYLNGINNIFNSTSTTSIIDAQTQPFGQIQSLEYDQNFVNRSHQFPNKIGCPFEHEQSLLLGITNSDSASFHHGIDADTYDYQLPSNNNDNTNSAESLDYAKRMDQLYPYEEQQSPPPSFNFVNQNCETFKSNYLLNYLTSPTRESNSDDIKINNSPSSCNSIDLMLQHNNNDNNKTASLTAEHDIDFPVSPIHSVQMKPTTHVTMPNTSAICKLAPSAQASTSITEGTSTSISALTSVSFNNTVEPVLVIDPKELVIQKTPNQVLINKPKHPTLIINDDFECFVNMFNVEENITNHIISKKRNACNLDDDDDDDDYDDDYDYDIYNNIKHSSVGASTALQPSVAKTENLSEVKAVDVNQIKILNNGNDDHNILISDSQISTILMECENNEGNDDNDDDDDDDLNGALDSTTIV